MVALQEDFVNLADAQVGVHALTLEVAHLNHGVVVAKADLVVILIAVQVLVRGLSVLLKRVLELF